MGTAKPFLAQVYMMTVCAGSIDHSFLLSDDCSLGLLPIETPCWD